MKLPLPRRKRGSSLRLTDLPSPWIVDSGTYAPLTGDCHVVAQLRGGVLNGLDDVDVTGAAAEVPRDAQANLVVGRRGVRFEQRLGRQNHARRAEATLQSVLLPESFLERVKRSVLLHPFDGQNVGAVGLHGEDRARLDWLAVQQDGAHAAVGRVAANMCPRQAKRLADEVHEQHPRGYFGRPLLTVDGDLHGHSIDWLDHATPPLARASARLSARL